MTEGTNVRFLKRIQDLPHDISVRKYERWDEPIPIPMVDYVVEYTDRLPSTNWATLSTIPGDGTVKTLSDPSITNHQRFYRARVP